MKGRMTASTLYKEWMKMRLYWGIAFACNILVFIYIYIKTRHMFVLEHAEMVWYQVIHIHTLFYEQIKYLPLATGIVLGAAQFIPEIRNRRLRLSLHLPVRPHVLVLSYLLIGLVAVGVICFVDIFLLYLIAGIFFPVEVVVRAMLTIFPWLLAGMVSFLGTSLVVLEPEWLRKIFCLAVSCGFVWLFFQSNIPGSYTTVIGKLSLASLFFIPAIALSVFRFRNRG